MCKNCWLSIETFHDFYNLVSANYNVESLQESKEEKYEPHRSVEAINTTDLIVYEEDGREMIDHEMIKVEVIQDTEYPEEWIEEYKPPESPKKLVKKKAMLPIAPPIRDRGQVRQMSALDSADDQRIRETANMNCDICHEVLDSLRDAKAHFKMSHSIEGYLICCERFV